MHTSRRLIVDVVAVGLSLRPCQGAGCDLREEYETIESFSSGFGRGNRGGGKSGGWEAGEQRIGSVCGGVIWVAVAGLGVKGGGSSFLR